MEDPHPRGKRNFSIFLFDPSYETHSELKENVGYGGITEWYYNRAEMVYGIFDQLELVRISEIVKWVDEFYSHGNMQINHLWRHLNLPIVLRRLLDPICGKNMKILSLIG